MVIGMSMCVGVYADETNGNISNTKLFYLNGATYCIMRMV